MANTIQLKRSSVVGKIPDAGNVSVGEPVINLADQTLYTKNGSGDIIVIGTGVLGNLSDVSNTAPTTGQVLTYDGAQWAPAAASGGTANTVLGVIVQNAFTANGTGSTYTLTNSTANANSLIVFVDSVLQEPITNYTVSGTTLTFTSAPANGANIDVRYFAADEFDIALGELNNVSNASPTTNDVLTWTGSQWVPQAVTAGVSSVAGAEGAVSNTQILSGLLTVDGAGSTLDADLLDGQQGSYYTNADNISSGTLNAARLATSGVSAATYGNATNIPVITVDTYGRITSASNVAVVGGVSSVGGATGDVTNVELAASITDTGILTTANVSEVTNLYYTDARVQANVTTFLTTAPNVDVGGNLTVSGSLNTPNFGVSDTLTIGSQVIYAQGNNGFSVNEDFDPSANALQTAYHFTSGAGRETVAFTLARTGQFTDGFGIYGTAADNKLVNFGEQSNTSFEWRKGVGIQPLNLSGGTLLANLSSVGNFYVTGNVHSPFLIGNVTGSASTVSSISNFTTTNLTEGTNLYYTDARVYSNVTQIGYATTSYVDNEVANLVASAPATLDTLNELAAALGDDPNFATTTATLIGNSYNQANAAYNQANTATTDAATATTIGQAAFAQANTATTIGQAAFASGNTKVATVAGVTATTISNAQLAAGIASTTVSNLTVAGNISISGSFIGDGSQLTNVSAGSSVTVSASPPVSPNSGDKWIESGNLIEYTYISDGDSSQWIQISASATLTSDTVVLTTADVTESTSLYFTNARVYANVTQIGYATTAEVNSSVGAAYNRANTAIDDVIIYSLLLSGM